MLVGPGIEVKAIEGFALDADRNQRHPGPNLAVEAVLVLAEIPRRIPEPQEARREDRAHARHQLAAGRLALPGGEPLSPSEDPRRRVLIHSS
jgi:hypothetical protein